VDADPLLRRSHPRRCKPTAKREPAPQLPHASGVVQRAFRYTEVTGNSDAGVFPGWNG
jgi:hypothetical protein